MFKIGWFSTGRDKAARDLLRVVQEKVPNIRIEFVFCDRKYGESAETDQFLDLVQNYKLPIISWSSRDFKPELRKSNLEEWREEYDRIVMFFLASHRVDVCVLAGYMLIVSPLMCRSYSIINLHPALPDGPKGSWQEVIWQLIETRAKATGAMIHLVTPELDAGSVISFCKLSLSGIHFDEYWYRLDLSRSEEIQKLHKKNLFDKIREVELIREFSLIVETLKILAEGEAKIKDGQVFDSRNRRCKGYDLSKKINKILEKERKEV